MDELTKQYVSNMLNHVKDQNPSEFSNDFNQVMNHKLAARINDERKVVAASYFSPRQTKEVSNA